MKLNRRTIAVWLPAGLALATAGWAFTYSLNDDTGLPIKWSVNPVVMKIKLGTSPILSDGSNYSTSAQAAMQTWNTILGATQFQGDIVTAGAPVEDNSLNEMAFTSTIYGDAFGPNTLAVTTGFYAGNERIESDILFNTAKTWDSYRGALHPAANDIRRVALHELGHVLGLSHPDDAGQTVAAIMNSAITNLDAITSDDTTGAQNLYGPPGVPANNNLAGAATITLAGNAATVAGYNTNATKETGEPNHAGNAGGRSVWWRWLAPSSGNATLDTRGSYFDTTLAVYTGNAVSALTTVAANDDIDLGRIQTSSLTFTATGGQTYYFAVDGYDADSAGLTLNLNFVSTGGAVPVISTQPTSQTVTTGNSASFTVVASSATTLSYQWAFNNTPLTSATGATYAIGNAQAANAGSYSVTVTNSNGSVKSNTVTLTVNTAPAPPATPPPSSGGGGGGGGAPSVWFCTILCLLGLSRWRRRFLR